MGIFGLGESAQVPRLELELTSACDHRCRHCYNVWNAPDGGPAEGYPRGQLPTDQYLGLLEKVIGESGARELSLTGGEPLLHPDALRIVERACALASSVRLVTNGSHVSPDVAARLRRAGVRVVQLTLLGGRKEVHDRLKGVASFDDTLRALLNLRDAGLPAQICFVATRENAADFADVLELCFAFGVRSLVYNRMCPSGGAIGQIAELLPEVDQVEANLELAERVGRARQIAVATAMPIPPCLIRIERYPWVRFGFCSTGTSSPNLVVDSLGNVRPCNLSSRILGNVLRDGWSKIRHAAYGRRFRRTLPKLCRGCAYERSCQGGCKQSAIATYGSAEHLEPFVHLACEKGQRGGA